MPNHLLTLDFLNLAESLDKVITFSATYPLDAIFSTDEEGVLLASALSKALGLPHNPHEAIRATQDKSLLRTLLSNAGVPTPQGACFSITEPPDKIEVTYPVVLKPIHLSGSRGVIRANNPNELSIAFQRIAKILSDPDLKDHGFSRNRRSSPFRKAGRISDLFSRMARRQRPLNRPCVSPIVRFGLRSCRENRHTVLH